MLVVAPGDGYIPAASDVPSRRYRWHDACVQEPPRRDPSGQRAIRSPRPGQARKPLEAHLKNPILSVLVVSIAAGGCATKKFVARDVGEVNKKVDVLSTEVEKTQERVRANEERIERVSEQAQSGIREAGGTARDAMTKADEAEKAAKGKIIYTVTLSDDKVTFPLGRAELADDTKGLIDETIGPFKAANKGVYFEIEGHTDSTGPDAYNKLLGEKRALAVRDYLHDQEGIALSRMQVISYGEASPIEDNRTPEQRKKNRRVVIKVLE